MCHDACTSTTRPERSLGAPSPLISTFVEPPRSVCDDQRLVRATHLCLERWVLSAWAANGNCSRRGHSVRSSKGVGTGPDRRVTRRLCHDGGRFTPSSAEPHRPAGRPSLRPKPTGRINAQPAAPRRGPRHNGRPCGVSSRPAALTAYGRSPSLLHGQWTRTRWRRWNSSGGDYRHRIHMP